MSFFFGIMCILVFSIGFPFPGLIRAAELPDKEHVFLSGVSDALMICFSPGKS